LGRTVVGGSRLATVKGAVAWDHLSAERAERGGKVRREGEERAAWRFKFGLIVPTGLV
jgi:hypothetical protein